MADMGKSSQLGQVKERNFNILSKKVLNKLEQIEDGINNLQDAIDPILRPPSPITSEKNTTPSEVQSALECWLSHVVERLDSIHSSVRDLADRSAV
jgi:hypothetical protein